MAQLFKQIIKGISFSLILILSTGSVFAQKSKKKSTKITKTTKTTKTTTTTSSKTTTTVEKKALETKVSAEQQREARRGTQRFKS
jgi:Mg2+/citrate symporter